MLYLMWELFYSPAPWKQTEDSERNAYEKRSQICSSCCLNVLSTFISWSCALWELPASNWFFRAYQNRMHALIAASLNTGSLRCTFVGSQSTVCQQGWPRGSRNAMNNWLKGRVYTQVVQLPVHTLHEWLYHPVAWIAAFFLVTYCFIYLMHWERFFCSMGIINQSDGFAQIDF